MSGDEKLYTEQDMINANRVAVLAAKHEDLASDYERVIPEVFASLKSLSKNVSELPSNVSLEIIACKERLEKEQRDYNHSNFVTKPV